MHKNQYKLLSNRRFLPFFITQSTQGFNDSTFRLTVLALVSFYLTSNADELQRWQSMAILLFNLPLLIFAALAGELADKYRKEKIIQIIKFFEVLLVFVAFVVLYISNISLMMATIFLFGLHSAFLVPVKYALLPELVAKDELLGANALIEASVLVAITSGSILGSLAQPNSGMHYINLGIIFAVATIGFICSLLLPQTEPAAPKSKLYFNPFKSIYESFHFSREHKSVFVAMIGIGWFWFVGASFTIEYPLYVKFILHGDGPVFSLFLSTFTIGILAGTLCVNTLLDGKISPKLAPLCAIIMGVCCIDLYRAGFAFHANESITVQHIFSQWRYWRLLLDIFLLAVSLGIYLVPLYAVLQIRSDKNKRARVMAANTMVYASFMLLASLFLYTLKLLGVGIPMMFLVIGLMSFVIAGYLMRIVPKDSLKKIFRFILKGWFKVGVEGLENYHAAPHAIIIANQTSLIDFLLLSAFLPDELSVVLQPRLAKKFWVRVLTSLGHIIYVDPSKAKAARALIKATKSGQRIVIFPETRLTGGRGHLKVYEGPGFIVDKSGLDILPIRIQGAQHSSFSLTKVKHLTQLRPKITIHIQPMEAIEHSHIKCKRSKRRALALQLYTLLSDMAFHNSTYQTTLFESVLVGRQLAKKRGKIIEDVQRMPVSYSQFIARCFILGKQIKKATVAGEYVGVLMPTTNAGMITFFALQAYRRIPAMLNFTMGIYNLYSACQTAKIKTIYTSRQFIKTAKIEEVVDKLVENGLNIIYLEDFKQTIKLTEKLAGLAKGVFPKLSYRLISAKVKSNEAGLVLFTSGSEGAPKGVVLSHENILANVYQMASKVDFSTQDIFFNSLPIFHSFGLTAGSILPLVTGNRVFFYPSPLHYKIIPGLVYDTSATIMFATDTFLTGYAHYAQETDFNSIRYIFAGAEKVKPETISHWSDKYGARIFEGYGATEASPVIAVNTPMANKRGSVGQVVSGLTYQIKDVEGIKEGGRLQIKGPNVMKGYLRADNPGEIERLGDDWYDTGDIVSADNNGFITIVGRAKRFAKLGGEMVSLTAVESVASALWPEEIHAAVIKRDPKRGEQIILLTEFSEATKKAFTAFVKKEGHPELLVPKEIRVVEKVPVLASGKIDYVTIQKSLTS